MRITIPLRLFRSDRRGLAAIEFALIAPCLIFLVMGVLEMSLRFRASEEASRYVHQVADLVAREDTLTTAQLTDIYQAAVYMMKPLDTINKLDLDIAQIGFQNNAAKTPFTMWRRVGGHVVNFSPSDANGMGAANEAVIHIGVRYAYTSPLSSMFGGNTMSILRTAYTRPREVRKVAIDTKTDDGGAVKFL
jgi:Flp pilus assembly protein TadG